MSWGWGFLAIFWMFGAGATLAYSRTRRDDDFMADLVLSLTLWPLLAGVEAMRWAISRATEKEPKA